MQGRHRGSSYSDDFDHYLDEEDLLASDTDGQPDWEDELERARLESEDDSGGASVLGMALVATSGAISGFFLAGYFETGAVAFVAITIGAIAGWVIRGAAQ